MLFSSNAFLFLFLPVVLVGYQLLSRFGRTTLLSWLTLASLFFYGYWNPVYLLLLGASIVVNFLFSLKVSTGESESGRSAWLTAAIVLNLALLMYYKYLFPFLNFFHTHHVLPRGFADVALPLGISFFTFTQIAYMIDVRQGIAKRQSFIPYSVFVTFFPHLIAGPIIHPRELMPQLDEGRIGPLRSENLAVGLTWFIMGLGKKVLIADRISPLADALYAHPTSAGLATSWIGALVYSMQVYYDFSGYSDMALGLARMFGIEFPLNFHSPYKCQSIIEFWQHWHMTLSRYLNEYLYTPIQRNTIKRRRAAGKSSNRAVVATPEGFMALVVYPTATTMLIAGIWHGAGLQFMAFGLLNGLFLVINHGWRALTPSGSRWNEVVPAPVMIVLTFLSVVATHIFFRAASVHDGLYVMGTMTGFHHGPAFADFPYLSEIPNTSPFFHSLNSAILTIGLCFFIAWAMPNTQEMLGTLPKDAVRMPSILPRLYWRMSPAWTVGILLLFCFSLLLLDAGGSFLYFQF